MDKNKRYFNARKLFLLDRKRKYEQAVTFKPKGLWYGFGDAWIEWCRSEMPRWIRPHVYEVEPNGARLLRLETEADMRTFNVKYKRNYYEEGGRRIEGMLILRGIDWPEVAERYDGVEIPRYFKQFRFDLQFMWYYGFDVPSGCVWNLEKVQVQYVLAL